MRVGNLFGRLSLFTVAGAVDVEKASSGRFAADPQAVYEVWDEFTRWGATAELDENIEAVHFDPAELGAPTPAPSQVFGIGLNYRDHAAESNFAVPDTSPRPSPSSAPRCPSRSAPSSSPRVATWTGR
jgi:2,4-diketo-3-deoxy-L-fuconate hydrolase